MPATLGASFLFQPGVAPPVSFVLQFSNYNTFINGITCNNQSNQQVGIWLSRLPDFNPDYFCSAYQFMAMPIASARYAYVTFTPTGTTPTGNCYITWTDQQVVASASQLPVPVTPAAVFDSDKWDQASFG